MIRGTEHNTIAFNAAGGSADEAIAQSEILLQAAELLRRARLAGVVLTIELEPTQPLRMGGYEPVITVRPARVMASLADGGGR